MSTVWAVVLAAGSGERFGSRKQFALVGGERAVDRAVRVVCEVVDGVVLVLPPDRQWDGDQVDAVAPGGATRSQSVRAGLRAVPRSAGVVLIHDAAHPLASPELTRSVLAAVTAGADAAFPGLPLADALKRTAGSLVVGSLAKDGLVTAQMPHAFRADVLREAHSSTPEAVEDLELVQASGARVVVVPGDPRNVHITTPLDLHVADVLASHAFSPLAGPAKRRLA